MQRNAAVNATSRARLYHDYNGVLQERRHFDTVHIGWDNLSVVVLVVSVGHPL
jgi:hypothetical protein